MKKSIQKIKIIKQFEYSIEPTLSKTQALFGGVYRQSPAEGLQACDAAPVAFYFVSFLTKQYKTKRLK